MRWETSSVKIFDEFKNFQPKKKRFRRKNDMVYYITNNDKDEFNYNIHIKPPYSGGSAIKP